MKTFGLIFALFGSLFACIGIGLAWRQSAKISAARPAEAVVLSSHIETHHSDDSTTYKPIVEYRYEVDGRTYTCDNVMPLSISSGHSWARRIVQQFPDGKQTTAHYDPKNPQKAFLIKRPSFFPYIFILFPMIFISVGVGIFCSAGASSRRPPVPVASGEAWFELTPKRNIGAKARGSWLGTGAWLAVGCAAAGHYFVTARPNYEVTAYVFSGIYALVGIGGVIRGLYFTILSGTIADARMFSSKDKVALGDEITIGVRQEILTMRMIEAVKMGMICKAQTRTQQGGKTSYSTATCYEEMVPVADAEQVRAGDTLEYSATIIFPSDQSPSSPPAYKGYPRYTWSVRLHVCIDNAPDYRADFPITVTADPQGHLMAESDGIAV